MRRRRYSFVHQDSVFRHREQDRPAVVPTSRSRYNKRRIVLFSLGALALLLLGIAAYLGFNFVKAANQVFTSDLNLKQLVSKSTIKQTDGRTNILLLGRGGANHPGGQLTDTILLVSINNSDKRTAFISIPRDLLVNIPNTGSKRINEAYAAGYNSEKSNDKKADAGAKMTVQVVEGVVGVPIHYYVNVDFVGFKDLVDSLGGVTVDVDQDLYDPMYPKDSFSGDDYTKTDAYTVFSLKKGIQTLNGETALKYARSRETTSDFDRSKRQQKLILAIKDKCLTLGVLTNPKKVSDLMSIAGSHIRTDLDVAAIKELLEIAQGVDQTKIINKVIDNDPKTGLLVSSSEGFYHLIPKAGANNFSQIQKMVKDVFSTADDQTVEDLSTVDVEVYNGSGVNGAAGKLGQQLKDDGLNVTKIETNSEEVDETTIYTPSTSSSALTKIKARLPQVKLSTSIEKNLIKIIIGRDYGK